MTTTTQWAVALAPEVKMETIRWSVAQIWSKKAPRLEKAVEDQEKGIFKPMYKSRRFVNGEKSEKEYPLIPGYMFFEVGASLRGHDGKDLDGVIRVLNRPVGELEMFGFVLRGAAQEWNQLEPMPAAPAEPKRSRARRSRPSKRARPGKHIRAKMRAERDTA